ncbi:beta-1,3-glucan-binding protein-like [Malaya genurostris]|uniref:beta-1,3-glucan-binding protein-like n=1 Tax=Malaya genurostris TaxID=325434 RepID=UPI0026F387D6|nr:beta-1,3-glucan-binding protein-like [Malaya genurostris]
MLRYVAAVTAGLLLLNAVSVCWGQCDPSPTSASGWKAPEGPYCSGQLIFEDNFDSLDRSVWEHENTVGGGGNSEFQWYSGSDLNSYIKDGNLVLRPTLTADEFGEEFLTSGSINLWEQDDFNRCTDDPDWAAQIHGCVRQGSPEYILNPVRSARLRTHNSFGFKYGKLEIRAKLPAGDWLWPALWLMPKYSVYGGWPASGEIDLMEARGNRDLVLNNEHIGIKQTGSCLHFGPSWDYRAALCNTENRDGLHTFFYNYQLIWTENVIQFAINDQVYHTITPYEGFWRLGGFNENPWPEGQLMAPFDQEFHLLLNVAVGGNFFPDGASNPHPKPWYYGESTAMTSFWNARGDWYSTWGEEAAMEIDYVRVWAL